MKRKITLLIATAMHIMIMKTSFAIAPEAQTKKNIKNAESLFLRGNYEEALIEFKKIEQVEFQLTEDQMLELGLCYYHSSKEKDKAIPYFEKSLLNQKTPIEIYTYLGELHQYYNNYDAAIRCYEMFLKKMKGNKNDLTSKDEFVKKISECYLAKDLEDKLMNVKVKNLGEGINSKYAEYGIVVSEKQKKLYFTSCLPEKGKGQDEAMDNIYFTELPGKNEFPTTYNKLKTGNHDAILGFTHDDEKMFVYENGDIYQTKISATNKWVISQKMHSPVNSSENEASIAISKDGKTLYFSSDRKGGYGGLDIYKCELIDGNNWGPGINLGPIINTKYDEDAPFIDPNGKILYFSSKGHSTMGGYDVFQYNLTKGGVPKSLGMPINSVNDDIYFSVDGNGSGYLTSDRKGGFGSLDLYRVFFEPPSIATTEIKGALHHTSSLNPLAGKITVYDKETNLIVANSYISNGSYSISVMPGKKYVFVIEAEKFASQTQELFIPYQSRHYPLYQSFQFDYIMGDNNLKIGQKSSMKAAFFDLESFFEKQQSLGNIDELDKVYCKIENAPLIYTEDFKKLVNSQSHNNDAPALTFKN